MEEPDSITKVKKRGKKAKWEPEGERAKAVATRAASSPSSARKGYLAAAHGRVGARSAVKAFCLQCTGYDRDSVRNCTALACPLWAYRPFQHDVKGTRVARLVKAEPKKDEAELNDIPDANDF